MLIKKYAGSLSIVEDKLYVIFQGGKSSSSQVLTVLEPAPERKKLFGSKTLGNIFPDHYTV
jgi:hypothetical protein